MCFEGYCSGHVRESCMISLTSESQRSLWSICYHLTCGFRAQAGNEHYHISVVATNTKGILRVLNYLRALGLCLFRQGSQCGSTETLLMCRWQQESSQTGSDSPSGAIPGFPCQHILTQTFLYDCYSTTALWVFFPQYFGKCDNGTPR